MPKEARTMTMLFIAGCLIVFAPKASGVVNGTFADLREFPYAVGFSHYREATDKWTVVCAGFVIDKWWVVTAAHCCDYCIMDNFEDCKMQLGATNFQKYPRQVISVKNVYRPKQWEKQLFKTLSTFKYDVCAIRTGEAIELNKDVKPICLPPPASAEIQLECSAVCVGAGWGRSECDHASPGTEDLMKVDATVDENNCTFYRKMGMVCARSTMYDQVPTRYPADGDSGHALNCKCGVGKGARDVAMGVFKWAPCPVIDLEELPIYVSTVFNGDFLFATTKIKPCLPVNDEL